jgi:hypothetical protein
MHARFPHSASETPIRSRVPARRSPPCRGTWGAGVAGDARRPRPLGTLLTGAAAAARLWDLRP